jgi:hypothetical protein
MRTWRQIRVRSVTSTAVVATVLAGVLLAPPSGAGAATAPAQGKATAEEVVRAKTALARALAVSLNDTGWAHLIRTSLAAGHVDPLAVARGSAGVTAARFRAAAEAANRTIRAAKGLPPSTGSILELRLAGGDPAARGAVQLVAVEVGDDRVTAVPAFDLSGREQSLDGRTAPAQTVAVIGIDEGRSLTSGLAVVRQEPAARGVSSGGAQPESRAAATGYWTTRVMSVRLADDEEPWIKGDAEIYSIVTGVGVDDQAQVDIVQTPYLDTDERYYYPGQILVNWSHFKWNAVDAVMMEEDDGTNYRALAQAIASALLTLLDGAQYVPMVNAILEAIPDSWWTDDPDYVDSWYLLTREMNELRGGARGNGTITFAPYYVTPV